MTFITALVKHPNIARLIKHSLLSLLLLWLFSGLSYFVPSPVFSVIALFIFAYFIVVLSKYAPATFVLLLTFIFLRITCLISGIAIEYGAEMIELELMGYATGAMLRLVMVYIFFITVLAIVLEIFYCRFTNEIDSTFYAAKLQNEKWVPILFMGTIFLTLITLFIAAKTGLPLLTGMSRLAFREEVDSKIFLLYASNRKIFILLLGLVFATCIGYKRRFSLALYIVTILVAILMGEKFTSLIGISILMFTPSLLLSRHLNSLNLVKLAVPLLALALFTLPVILNADGWSEDPVMAMEKLTSRFAGQAQVWFLADSEIQHYFAFDLDSLLHNVRSFLNLNGFELANISPYFGARYFMYNFMSEELLTLFLETKALTLTMAFEPYLLMTNGWLGQLLPLSICAVFYALILTYISYGIFKANPISLFIAVKLLVWSAVALQQGELYFMFGLKFLGVVFIAFLYEKIFVRYSSISKWKVI
jgi:hypothetical protein